MTAASPVRSPSSSSKSQSTSSPACPPACHRHLKKGKAIRSRLPLRSAPGVWLIFGVCVVLVGMCVAVAGYVSAAPKPVGGRGSTHVERMKLAGPIVMGVGLFIFICAATLLYENRDREVRRQETFDDLEDLKGRTGWEDSFGCQEVWECNNKPGEPATWATPAHLLPLSQHNWGSLQAPPTALRSKHNRPLTPLLRDAPEREDTEAKNKRGTVKGSTLLACVLHHQEPKAYPPSPCLSIRSDSYSINFSTRTVSPLPAEF